MPQDNFFDQFDGQAQPVPVQQLRPIVGAVSPEEQARKAAEDERKAAEEERARFKFQQEQADREQRGGAETTESEKTAAFLATRVANGLRTLSNVKGGKSPEVLGSIVGSISQTAGNYVTSEDRQRVETAQRDILHAALTLGTGAAYTAEQLEGYRRAYFPQLGDSEGNIADKQQALKVLLEAAKVKAGAAAPAIDEALAAAYGETVPQTEGNAAIQAAFDSGASRDELIALAQRLGVSFPGGEDRLNEMIAFRDGGGQGATFIPQAAPTDPRDEMGFFESIGETITGNARETEETRTLPDAMSMPELNSLSFDSFQAGLGTLFSNPAETVAVLRSQFPGIQVRQDEKGNFILRSSQDGKEYAIKPGFAMSDIPRAAGAVAAFTPAGRAATLPGSFAAGAGTQAVIEGTQAATGGTFDPAEVAIAGGGNAAGSLLVRGVGAGINRFRGARAAEAPQLSPMAAAPEPVAAPQAPAVDIEAAAGANLTRPIPETQASQFGEVAKTALGRGTKARAAKEQLAVVAQANPEAKAAAQRLGIELPVDVIADDARLLTTQGLARSQIGSGAQSEWGATVRAAIDKSDATLAEIGASRDLAQLSDDVRVRLQGDMDTLEAAGNNLRADVNAAIDVRGRVEASNLEAALGQRINDLGGIKEAKQAFSSEEKKLLAMLGEGEVAKRPTYAYLDQLRDDIGKALFKKQGPWADTNEAALKKYYGALASDRVAHVESIGGKDLADKLRASNDTFVKMYGVRETMQTVFGQKLEKDIGTLVTRAIGNAAKGDAKDLRTVLAAVPKDMQPRTVLSAIMAKAERSSAGGGFSFDNYAKLYRGMRQNAPIYAEIAKTVGPESAQILQDLYVISSRMSAAEAKIVRTGASNQPILNALKSETLVAKTLDAGKRIGARGAGAVVGGMAGGPVGAAVGQEVSGALIDAAATGGKRNLEQLHTVLSSDAFRDLVVKVGNGADDARAVNKLAGDPKFVRFGKQIGLGSFEQRRQWIMDALTASPAPGASGQFGNVVQFQQGALPLAAEGQTERADSNTTGQGTR